MLFRCSVTYNFFCVDALKMVLQWALKERKKRATYSHTHILSRDIKIWCLFVCAVLPDVPRIYGGNTAARVYNLTDCNRRLIKRKRSFLNFELNCVISFLCFPGRSIKILHFIIVSSGYFRSFVNWYVMMK